MTTRHSFITSHIPLRLGLLAVALSFPIAGCDGCQGPDLDPVAPTIELIDPFDEEASPCAVENFRECSYDFGDVAVTGGRFFRFRVLNDSTVRLSISDITFEGDPAFELNDDIEFPLVVEPAEQETEPTELTVRFAPSVESTVTSTMTIVSDGQNLDDNLPDDPSDDEHVVVELSGNGIDNGRPELVINPAQCDFGEVGVNVAAFCDVTLENIGTLDLEITGVSFSGDTPLAIDGSGNFDTGLNGFGSQTFVFVPMYIAPGTATTVRLFANPPTVGDMTGIWNITSNDPGREVAEVPLTVAGAEAPTAVAEVLSVNGVPNNDPSPQVQPLDDVILTGENSVAATVGETIVSYQWEIVSRPAESSVVLTSPNSVTTGFQFESAAGTFLGLDVVGEYRVRLTVTDSGTAVSTNDATVSLNAIPSEALHVQLTWDSPDYDYDLHMIKDGGPYCSQQSCYYGNCNADNALFGRPEWDGISGETNGDPSLDIDDLDGYGPENINIDNPVDGNYRIAVHAYSPLVSTEVWATLKVFVNGALAFEDSRQMSTGRDFWEVAEVQWNGSAIVFPVGDYEGGWSCP